MAISIIKQVTNNSGSNYCKMPDGTLIQWGADNIPKNASSVKVVFPTSFANDKYGMVCMPVYANSRDVMLVYASSTKTTTDIYRGGSDFSYIQLFTWIAIGRWK